MGFLKQPSTLPQYTNIQVSTSTATAPIAVCYGTPLVATNLLEGINFRAPQDSKKQNKNTSSQQGRIDVLLALGEFPATEPVANAFAARMNGQYYPIGQLPPGTTDKGGTFDFMNIVGPPYGFGTNDLRPYPGIVLFKSHGLTAGTNASIPQFEILLFRKFQGTCPLNFDPEGGFEDADPAQCIYDMLTYPRYGAGFPTSLIDSTPGASWFSGPNASNSSVGDAAFQTYCQAVGFGFSTCLRNAEPAKSVLDRWAKILVTAVVWNGMVLKLIPYYDMFNGDNPGYTPQIIPKKYFNPNIAPLFDFGDDIILQSKSATEDPLTLNRIDPADIYNIVRVTYKDRGNEYNSNIAFANDENNIETGDLFGPFVRVEDIQAGEDFTFSAYAQTSANLIRNRNLAIQTKGEFDLGWEYAMLDPMDILTITDNNLGLNRYPIRITTIEEQEDYTLKIEFEQFPIGAAAPAIFAGQGSNSTGINTQIVPDSVNPPLFAEPGPQLVLTPTLFIAASGGSAGVADPNWGGCEVWMSADNGSTYTQIGSINGPSTMGVLTANLPAFSGLNPDNTNTLSISVAESDTILNSVSSGNALAGIPYSVIKDSGGGQEFLSFQTATLASPNNYNLTTLYRGLGGSNTGWTHVTGAQFAVLDSGVLTWVVPSALIGTQLWFKFLSFNIYGQQVQALSGATPYSYTPGATYVEDVGTGATHQVNIQPSFISDHISWHSATTSAKTETILGAVNCTSGYRMSLNDSQGTAATYPITIIPASGTIGGQATYVISSPYGLVNLIADPSNNDWVLVS